MPAILINAARVDAILKLGGGMLEAAYLRELEVQGVELAQYVKFRKLSGQVLHVRTGTLRRSIHASPHLGEGYVDVGTNVPYARVWELGFRGTVSVAAHLRHLKSGKVSRVRSYTMKRNDAARPFLRPSLVANKSKIARALRRTIRSTLSELAGGAT